MSEVLEKNIIYCPPQVWKNLLETDCIPQNQSMAGSLQEHDSKEMICSLWEPIAALSAEQVKGCSQQENTSCHMDTPGAW